MFNLQGSEIIVILLLALVVLGPEKLPDAVRRFTKTYNELKKMGSGFQSELKSALDEPMREMRETADMIRDAADPDKIAAGTHAAPTPGDPPLIEPDPTADAAPADDPRPVNQVAAANASGAISAAAASSAAGRADDSPDDHDGDAAGAADAERADAERADAGSADAERADAGSADADRAAADGDPAPVVPGPRFHSAAPRRVESSPDGEPGEGPPDRAAGAAADDGRRSVESTDETATA